MSESITVTGLKETQKALYAYSQQLGDRVVLASLRQGAAVVLKAVRATAPVYQGKPKKYVIKGALRRGFRVFKSKIHNGKMSGSMIGVYLTIKKGKGRGTDDPFYGRWIENGWNARGKKNAPGTKPELGIDGNWRSPKTASRFAITSVFGSRTGRKSLPGKTTVPGIFFVKKAFESNKNQAVAMIENAITRGAEIVKRKVGLK